VIGAISQVTSLPNHGRDLPDHPHPPGDHRAGRADEMLEEAVTIIAELFTGEQPTHRSRHYQVETARLYSLPTVPPPVYVSGFGEKSASLAARIADGYICMGPQADLIKLYREGGGDRPVQGGIKGCWAPDAGQARQIMHRLWPNDSIPGESAQLLPLPRHFGQLAQLVSEDMVSAPCGPDPEPYIQAIGAYEEAGFDEVYLGQVGGRLEGAFEFFATQVLPQVRGT
jgi:G6PDH family F420-dependent oxidoreductase